ncbi:hypothetical protein HMPREF9104_00052 [Lentilactobacillus kisonensis F0435]|uniref:DUF5776 domain-containing protein n=1 Tax=Lentilactobacillus kisonensis F0435 TaxID=797516 RepID=H1LBU2_9LACO|nr:hypothetical protein HMPREF9104_00052 [Lentilactobacillus kisonensis F0435]
MGGISLSISKVQLKRLILAGMLTITVAGAATYLQNNQTMGNQVTAKAAVLNMKNIIWNLNFTDDAQEQFNGSIYGDPVKMTNNPLSGSGSTLQHPVILPEKIMTDEGDQSFTIQKLWLNANNYQVATGTQSDFIQLTIQEYDRDRQPVSNPNLKPQFEDESGSNYGFIQGFDTVAPGNLIVLTVTPNPKAIQNGTMAGNPFNMYYTKAKNGGVGTPKIATAADFSMNYSYGYSDNADGSQPTIIDANSDTPDFVASDKDSVRALETGYIQPKWSLDLADPVTNALKNDITVNPDGMITGLSSDSVAGKTIKVSVTDGLDATITHTLSFKVPAKDTKSNNDGGSTIAPVNSVTTNSDNTVNRSNDGQVAATQSKPITVTKNDAAKGDTAHVAQEGASVYATKKIYLYKHANFKKGDRIAAYPKAKRVNRPMFVVTDYARSKSGTLRYKVRDVNHHSKTAGKVGYITANRKYVVPVYYASMPKDKKVTVISKNGINAYKKVNLTKNVKHYKNGAHLSVKKIVKHNLTTRYVLSNGSYVTANKKLVIQGVY